ncbi:MAG TPA: WYL domain-containing protein, partial [Euzebyales bacterium]|nr:WYL domain-containing protein [Euzebyales bacterium]
LDGLTGDEAAALFLAGVPDAAGELGLSAVLVAAQEKVLATLPAELRGRAARIRERFHLDAPGWFHHDESVPHLGTVAAAVWSGRRLTIRYRTRSRDVERLVEPLGVVLKAGTWYLVAGAGDDVRSYRVGRIVAARQTDGGVRRPADFDLATWWAASSREFSERFRSVPCRLRLSPWALGTLPYIVDTDAARDAVDAAGPPDDDGWREVVVGTESVEVAADQLTALGAGVEVVAPPELRHRLRAIGAAMAARNA